MSRIIAFAALALALIAGALVIALRPKPPKKTPPRAAQRKGALPRWGSVALRGAVMRYRPEDGGTLEVIYPRRDEDPSLPRPWIAAHPSARLAVWPAEGALLRELYKELEEGGVFTRDSGSKAADQGGVEALAIFDGRRTFTATAPAEAEGAAAFRALTAAFERAASRARAAQEAAEAQASDG